MKEKITLKIFNFFINSKDFNGIPLRQISEDLKVDYEESINIIKELVQENKIVIQSSTNPHIIGKFHYPIKSQLEILESSKKQKLDIKHLVV